MNVPERLQNLRDEKLWQWGELADALGVGNTMLHYLRKGKRKPSQKIARRLEELELEAGLRPPPRQSRMVKEDSASYVTKNNRDEGEIKKQISSIESTIASLQEKIKQLKDGL